MVLNYNDVRQLVRTLMTRKRSITKMRLWKDIFMWTERYRCFIKQIKWMWGIKIRPVLDYVD